MALCSVKLLRVLASFFWRKLSFVEPHERKVAAATVCGGRPAHLARLSKNFVLHFAAMDLSLCLCLCLSASASLPLPLPLSHVYAAKKRLPKGLSSSSHVTETPFCVTEQCTPSGWPTVERRIITLSGGCCMLRFRMLAMMCGLQLSHAWGSSCSVHQSRFVTHQRITMVTQSSNGVIQWSLLPFKSMYPRLLAMKRFFFVCYRRDTQPVEFVAHAEASPQ